MQKRPNGIAYNVESREVKGCSEILSGMAMAVPSSMVASSHAESLARALLGGQTASIQEPHSSHADVK